MTAPPLLAGPVNRTRIDASLRSATPITGAPGSVAGTAEFVAADAVPVPTAFDAVTEHVYEYPLASPETTAGLAVEVADPAVPPLEDTQAVAYPVMVDPPLLVGAVNVTEIWALPRVAVPITGAVGTVAGTVAAEADEAAPEPTVFVATTVHE